ncbi:DNA helicase [Acinetobacter phage vB_AbaM_CP14]|nr:DNA helicase [Acinetobacter phage vB_AbaM_CP14]
MKRFKIWIAPVLAALALGVISCTQPNQTAHSAGAQYTGYLNKPSENVPVYPAYAKTTSGTYVYRIIDCQARSIVYTTSGGGGMTSQTMVGNSKIYNEFCGE